ncbi:MAG: TetR/AcrR family transcriptional regulator [Gammaproteobacteria bacterium]|nr:TetR/AcrR family transcriptional regulator [Gammaproteobacteria bacterium]
MATKKKRLPKANGNRIGSVSDKMLEVALDLFSEKDYAAVTISEIAKKSGVTHALVYYYFQNKEQIFHSAIQNSITQTVHNYNAVKERHDNPVDLLNDWLDNNIQLSGSLRKLVKIMFDYSENRGRSPSVEKDIEKFYDQENTIIADCIRDGIRLKLFKKTDPKKAARFVSTHIDGIFYGSIVRSDVKIAQSMTELKKALWAQLGYTPG